MPTEKAPDPFSLAPTITEEAELVAAATPPPEPLSLPELVEKRKETIAALEVSRARVHIADNARVELIGSRPVALEDEKPEALQARLEEHHTRLHSADDEYNTALEEWTVLQAAHEATTAALQQAASDHYHFLRQDKRGDELDIDCCTWPSYTEVVRDDNLSHARQVIVTHAEGCKCDWMPVKHTQQKGHPWCPAHQAPHRDDTPPCAFITEEQFIRRFIA